MLKDNYFYFIFMVPFYWVKGISLSLLLFYYNRALLIPLCQVNGILIHYMLVYFNRALLIRLFVKFMDA